MYNILLLYKIKTYFTIIYSYPIKSDKIDSLKFKTIFLNRRQKNVCLLKSFTILRAVQYMRNVHDFNKFLICTDSLSILKAINGFPKNKNPSYIILDIIEDINNLRVDGKVIEILWIPSHTGIPGNEDVDRLGCLTNGIPHSLELTPNEIRSIIKKRIYRDWQNLWSTSSMVKGHHFF